MFGEDICYQIQMILIFANIFYIKQNENCIKNKYLEIIHKIGKLHPKSNENQNAKISPLFYSKIYDQFYEPWLIKAPPF